MRAQILATRADLRDICRFAHLTAHESFYRNLARFGAKRYNMGYTIFLMGRCSSINK